MEKKKIKKPQNNPKAKGKNGIKSGGKPIFKGKIKGGVREDAEIKTLSKRYATINAKEIEKFSDFPLSRKTLQALQKCKFAKPTEIQRQSIGYALQGRDILGAAITGSGKTLGKLRLFFTIFSIAQFVQYFFSLFNPGHGMPVHKEMGASRRRWCYNHITHT